MFPAKSILRCEELGGRVMPSAPVPVMPAPTAIVSHTHAALQGLSSGTAVGGQITGTGHAADLGAVGVSGTVKADRGTITVANARGSVTLELTPLAPGSKYYRYTIVSGTGDSAHISQHGTLRIDLPAAGTGAFRLAI